MKYRLHSLGWLILGIGLALMVLSGPAHAQKKKPAPRGSLVEDRAARKLVEAGDARLESGETAKAVEVWQSVIERYPRSKVRFQAHLRLGDYLMNRDRAYDRARGHFATVADEENTDEAQRALATLSIGICFYELRNYGKSFQVMREVIEQFPLSPEVNQAYYYIGLGHFQLGHYSRAIRALEKVGTVITKTDAKVEKVEAGKRLFVKIEDADLAALEKDQSVQVKCETTQGDVETVKCLPIGRNVRIVLGSIPTRLGKPQKGNGRLEVQGNDKVKVTYIDKHTADKKFDRPVVKDIQVVGNALVEITDGAFGERLQGVVLSRGVNVQINDADLDLTDGADELKAVVEVYREKTPEELLKENAVPEGEEKVDRYKKIDSVTVTLVEVKIVLDLGTLPDDPKKPDAPNEPKKAVDDSIHSGVFRVVVPLVKEEKVVAGDDTLQAVAGDLVRVTYEDKLSTASESRTVQTQSRCLEGNLGGVRVTQSVISDQELRIKTRLKTAEALTNIGNRYKEFGLKKNADGKYELALKVCEEVLPQANRLKGRLLEETYVQLWKIYFEMNRLELAAAMSQRLQNEFPNSEFVDAALIQLAQVARKQGQLQRAVGIYNRLLGIKTSQLRGEAQFGIAECYEAMAKQAPGAGAAQFYDRAFQEYKKVYEGFPESGRVGEAVAKMANYYYQQKDYKRAIDTFESVLSTQPDAKFLDVILFNYGRCLYRMERRADAGRMFNQLIADFPESPLAPDAKRIVEALRKKSGS